MPRILGKKFIQNYQKSQTISTPQTTPTQSTPTSFITFSSKSFLKLSYQQSQPADDNF